MPLSVVIITFNEEKNIGRCIDSVLLCADEIIVLDSYSSDDTLAIARSKGAVIHQSGFDGYISQKNKAINLASYDRVLLLDADEAISKELSDIIISLKYDFSFHAFSMNRCNYFCGSFIKRGLWYPDRKLRLFDRRIAKCGGMNPHDKIVLTQPLPVKHLKADILHYTYDTLEEYLKRNEEVSTIAARSMYEAGIHKPWTKNVFSPLWAFVNGYLLRFGFLDGRKGFIIAYYTAQQSLSKYQKLRRLYREELKEMALE
jgi:glycosyltransferase involved in cell wall biosynthesis